MTGHLVHPTEQRLPLRPGHFGGFTIAAGLAALLLVSTSPARADVKDGVDAWSAGDYAGAVAQWQPLADKGDPDALFNLAQAYKLGRGVPLDNARALDLYRQAAQRGHVQAADSYGLALFQSGEREKALPYLQSSAERGDARAMYILGIASFNGDLVSKDWPRAYALMTLAQQQALPQAPAALKQMDAFIPLDQRQQGVALSQKMAVDAQAARTRLSTASELGTVSPAALAPTPAVASTSAPQPVARPALIAGDPVEAAIRRTGTSSPATAGADYARPARVTPPPSKMASAPKPVATAPKPASPKPAPPKPAAPVQRAATAGPWRVQLGAFGVSGNADKLWNKLRSRPELAGHGKVLEPEGKLVKLQAGGFASSADAEAACSRLSAGGFACLPVRN